MIEILTDTGSTNAVLADRLRGDEPVLEGSWVIADRQTSGRGRQGRTWFDGAGNFMGSTVVRLRDGDPPAATLALLAGLALFETVAASITTPHVVTLKWPNDLLVNGAKLAGILLERAGDTVIVGIGVNLAQAPTIAGRATVALADLAPVPDRNTFADDLARSFALELDRWRTYGIEPVMSRWLAAGHPLGTPLLAGDPPLSGTFAGLTADGALQLQLADGTTHKVHAGEVTLCASH